MLLIVLGALVILLLLIAAVSPGPFDAAFEPPTTSSFTNPPPTTLPPIVSNVRVSSTGHLVKPKTSWDDFMAELEEEAKAEGPEAVKELAKFHTYFASLAAKLKEREGK
jgi:hypothetical protein